MYLLNKRIIDLIIDSDLTQQEIADAIGVDRVTINRFVNGHYDLKLYNAVALARFFDISLDYLTGLSDTPVKLSDNKKRHS